VGMTDPNEIKQTWGSHQPLLKSFLSVVQPKTAVECGCGNFSTPHLQKVPHLITIEHDRKWADRLQKKFPHKWIIKEAHVRNPKRIKDLPSGEWERINAFYKETAAKLEPFDFLFVDTIPCCRIPAILHLGHLARTILLHDVEPPGDVLFYEYPRLYTTTKDHPMYDFEYTYLHRPSGKIRGKYTIPWTVLFSRDLQPINRLNKRIVEESRKLWGPTFSRYELEVHHD